jgi:hypothetical protein
MRWLWHRCDNGLMAAGRLPRSHQWPAVRRAHLQAFPTCAACGGTDALEVHHVLPYHVCPSAELEPANLLTLCAAGPSGMDCHLYWGHGGDWSDYCPTAPQDATEALKRVAGRVRA